METDGEKRGDTGDLIPDGWSGKCKERRSEVQRKKDNRDVYVVFVRWTRYIISAW